jgi:DNA modification methylase
MALDHKGSNIGRTLPLPRSSVVGQHGAPPCPRGAARGSPTSLRDRVVELRRVPVAELLPHGSNFRRHPRHQTSALKGVLRKVGFAGAALARKGADGGLVLIDGHLRRDTLPGETIPVLVTDLTQEEADLVLATYDPIGAMATRDDAVLGALLASLSSSDADVNALLERLGKLPASGLSDPDDPVEPIKDHGVRRGDFFQLGEHRLLCGDSTKQEDVKRLLRGEQPFLMLTDPPYGVELEMEWRDRSLNKLGKAQPSYMRRKEGHHNTSISGDTRADWSEAFELVPSITVAYVWHADRFTLEVGTGLRRIGFQLAQLIIWDKGMPVPSRTHYAYQHEPCWYARRKGSPRFIGPLMQPTIWAAGSPKKLMSGSKEEKIDHPTQKPVLLYTTPITNHLPRGGAFYEPFSGSGTALVAAEQLGRRCFAMELAPEYVAAAVARWETFTGKKAVRLDHDQETKAPRRRASVKTDS